MQKTFQFRLRPTEHQRILLTKTLDACRWVYNETLETRKNAWEQEQKALSLYDTNKLLTGWKVEKPELREAHSQILQNAQERVDLAFKAFFRRVKAESKEPGYPRFKSFRRYDSFTFKQSGFDLLDNGLSLSKIGVLKIVQHRPIEGEIKTLTIRRDRIGNWFASFSCKVKDHPLTPTDKVVGIDLGLTTFAVFSDGNEIARKRWMKEDAKDIARLQRKKERLEKNSPDHKKAIHALRHAYQRQTNRRKNFAHQESRKLVNAYQFIAFEDLNIVRMQAKGDKVINRGIADVAWGRFVQFTTYKAVEAGRGIVLVDPRNTTQMCSGCGEIVPKDLSVRKHKCPHCGLELSRDLNAALNILARGLASFRLRPVEATPLLATVE
ncbi:MAG: transposase [Patescibacteria group bacterium]|jgi:putative transposase